MDISTIVNSLGLFLDAVGVLIVFINSPVNFNTIDGGENASDDDFNKAAKAVEKRNRRARHGLLVILAGFILQIISNFL